MCCFVLLKAFVVPLQPAMKHYDPRALDGVSPMKCSYAEREAMGLIDFHGTTRLQLAPEWQRRGQFGPSTELSGRGRGYKERAGRRLMTFTHGKASFYNQMIL